MTHRIRFRGAPLREKFLIAVVCFLGLSFNIWIAVQNGAAWGVDFNQFYAASHLAGTGHLYDWDALQKVERENGLAVLTGRLPVVIYGYKLFGGLSYTAARLMWAAGCITVLTIFAACWPGTSRPLMTIALAWSTPLTLAILFGQDIPFWLMFFALGLLLIERRKPWVAGVVFSLCICKFHLALGIPCMLAAQKRWKTLIAGAVAFGALIAACFLIEGSQWPLQYKKMSEITQFAPAIEAMPNINALAARLPWPTAAEILGAAALLVFLWKGCRESTDLGMVGAVAAAVGLLIGHHGLVADSALLIPLMVLTIQKQGIPLWLKVWAILMLSPATMLLIMAQHSLVWQLLIVGFVVVSLIFWCANPVRRRMPWSTLARSATADVT